MPNPTFYEILDISPSLLAYSHETKADLVSQLLRRAYHRALLRHHPDKAQSEAGNDVNDVFQKPCNQPVYTVDQITTAYNTLRVTKSRNDYDEALRNAARSSSLFVAPEQEDAFQTGIEVVDLDDLLFEEMSNRWYMDCRCGNERGFEFGEEALDEKEREIFVGCQDCSLWIKVQYDVEES